MAADPARAEVGRRWAARNVWRRRGALLLLSPLVGEFLLGNVSVAGFGYLLLFLPLHAVWSIAVSVAPAEALVPDRARRPWLGHAVDVAGNALFAGALALLLWREARMQG